MVIIGKFKLSRRYGILRLVMFKGKKPVYFEIDESEHKDDFTKLYYSKIQSVYLIGDFKIKNKSYIIKPLKLTTKKRNLLKNTLQY